MQFDRTAARIDRAFPGFRWPRFPNGSDPELKQHNGSNEGGDVCVEDRAEDLLVGEPEPLEFGYGDTPHTTNRLPIGQLYTHMANIRHLYAESLPEAAALARYVQERLPNPSYSRSWFIYPFLLTRLEKSPEAARP